MITRASSICGMGDALNQRAFLVAYCKQKNIPRSAISVYTEKHSWVFDGMGFTMCLSRSAFGGLVAYRNFGFYDLQKRYEIAELDKQIAKNAGIDYCFEMCVPLPHYAMPRGVELPERYITFNTGYGTLSGKPGYVCLKSWPKAHWTQFVAQIGVPCVQIGGGHSCELIPGAINLVNKLTITQSAEVMRRGLFHIDMEGGLPILAQHLGKRSVVLFGPTAIQNQGRSFNLNISADVCVPCYEWGNRSAQRLYALKSNLPCGAKCMSSITPAQVIDAINKSGWLDRVPEIDKRFVLGV